MLVRLTIETLLVTKDRNHCYCIVRRIAVQASQNPTEARTHEFVELMKHSVDEGMRKGENFTI